MDWGKFGSRLCHWIWIWHWDILITWWASLILLKYHLLWSCWEIQGLSVIIGLPLLKPWAKRDLVMSRCMADSMAGGPVLRSPNIGWLFSPVAPFFVRLVLLVNQHITVAILDDLTLMGSLLSVIIFKSRGFLNWGYGWVVVLHCQRFLLLALVFTLEFLE